MRSPLIEATCACHPPLAAAARSGAKNMAIDAALLARANGRGLSFWRLSRFDPPCLSLGRNEPAARYDHTEIARRGLDVVRRPTGGRAVWHEHEVTRSEEHTSELQSRLHLVCRLLLEKKKKKRKISGRSRTHGAEE